MAISKTVGASITRLARDARFVFTGTVQQIGGSSLSIIPGGPGTAVVRVDRIHRAASALHNQAGRQVTVVSQPGAAPEAGHTLLVFFTNPIFYGETIGVREIGHIEAPPDLDALHELVAHGAEEAMMDELRKHLELADAVVHGKVVGLRHVSQTTAATAGEHDPDWWVAVVRVTKSFKGDHAGELKVRYPGSRDVRWYHVPKPKEGQEAIFILHRDGVDLDGAHFALLHPGDLLAADAAELRRVAGLLSP
jgi:hypothetical protein